MDLNDLATAANNLGHTTPREAKELVELLATGGAHPDDHAELFAALYQSFMPNKPKAPRSGTAWVNMAINGAEDKQYSTDLGFCADNGEYVCTNRHRLHMLRNSDLAPGLYDKKGAPAKSAKDFPPYARVIPDTWRGAYREYKLSDVKIEVIHQGAAQPKGFEYAVNLITEGEHAQRAHRVIVNKKYWDEAVCGFEHGVSVFISDHALDSVVIDDGARLAVLVPLNRK